LIAYPDTSFLCALYRKQDNKEFLSFDENQNALAAAEGLKTPLADPQ